MFPSDQDTERIIPRKRIDFLKIGTNALAVTFVLLYISFDIFADMLPTIPQLNYETLIIILLVLIFVMPLSINMFSKWLQSQKWRALADEIGFQTKQDNRVSMPALHGTLRGHQIKVSQTAERRGRSRVFFTQYEVTLAERVSSSFKMQKRRFTSFNQEKTGDEEFDKKYTTSTTDERLVNNILRTRRLRLGLLQLGERARTRTLTLNHTTLTYIESGETADTEYIKAVMGFLSEMAHIIERNQQFDL
jgi:hypothetical protein